MTGPEIVTYIIAPILAGLGVIGGIIKWVIPRIVDAKLEGEKDTRGYSQKKESLEQLSRLSNSAASSQVVAELLAASQDKEEKANDFIRSTVFNEIRDLSRRFANLENRQRLLANLITGGKLAEDEEPTGDYDAWAKNKPSNENPQPPIKSDAAGRNAE